MPAHALHANAAAWTKYPSIAMDGMDCGHRHMHRIACLPSQPASVPEALDVITCAQHFAIVTLARSEPNCISSHGRTFALPVIVNNMYGVSVPKAATAGSFYRATPAQPRAARPQPLERRSHDIHTNEHRHPSSSFQSVTRWCRPFPGNHGHVNFPPGLHLHEISGTPSVGPAPDGYSSADTSGLHLELKRAQRLRSQIAKSSIRQPSTVSVYSVDRSATCFRICNGHGLRWCIPSYLLVLLWGVSV